MQSFLLLHPRGLLAKSAALVAHSPGQALGRPSSATETRLEARLTSLSPPLVFPASLRQPIWHEQDLHVQPGIRNCECHYVKARCGLEAIADTNDEATKQQSLQIMLLKALKTS